ncbi:unnamed protein product [Paramecium pentaurelia]|uniref:Uncharacterized protein n=1 Tax=Paramecium pentaurelia TaxID=43138 RepID=A0A8S1YKC2_9CILI|nr:unnamed protein product [Paramecium pentaurelia]
MERIDLELIEKEFGEFYMEDTDSLSLPQRIMKIIKGVSIDTITINNLNQNQLNIEREKKINLQENCEVVEELKQLISQIQMVVKILRVSFNLDLEIFQMPIFKRVKELKQKFDKFNTKYDDKNKDEKKIVEDENYVQNKIRTNLSIIISILKILLKRTSQVKQKLNKLLQNVTNFTLQECYDEMYTSFSSWFQKHLNKIKESLFTTANIQQFEKESSQEYFLRIQNNILSCVNQSDNNNSQSTNIVDFLYKLMAETKEKLKISKCEFQEIQFNQDYLVQLTEQIYLQEKVEENEVKAMDQFSVDYQKNDEWKFKQDFVEQLHRNNYSILLKNSHLIMDLRKRLKSQKFIKNQHVISLQMQILQKDWQTQQDRIAGEMQKMLSRIDFCKNKLPRRQILTKESYN